MEKLLVVNWELCTGCRTCTFVCSFHHERVFSPSTSRIQIIKQEERGVNIPVICEQREKPPCFDFLQERVLEEDDEGILKHLEGLFTRECNLCEGSPQCVKYCTPSALQWVDRTQRQLDRKRKLDENRRMKLREVL